MHMSQQSEMADQVYWRLAGGPVSAAILVQEIQARWGVGHSIASVRLFVSEVANGLLHRSDVEVGCVRGGHFSPWGVEPWEAADRIEKQLRGSQTELNESDVVFRLKAPNQSSEPTPASVTPPAGQESRPR